VSSIEVGELDNARLTSLLVCQCIWGMNKFMGCFVVFETNVCMSFLGDVKSL